MIERKIVGDRFLEFKIDTYIRETLRDVPISTVSYEKVPQGEKVTVFTTAPGLVIGREGSNIKQLTRDLKEVFGLENPQIKIGEVDQRYLSAPIVAKIICNNLASFGPQKFKLTAFKAIQNIMISGAMGCEIRITGKIPSARAKSWRFFKGYLKKTGYVSDFVIDSAVDSVTLKSGVVGIKVKIMKPDTPLPDKVQFVEQVLPDEVKEMVQKAVPKEGDIEAVADEIAVEESRK
ncbi:MAG: 30S ribosomal protein S3 [Nanoarchaeota archaeon]|nr:30S ribosomal protein S3 [Nanoarchaeota archaeon]